MYQKSGNGVEGNPNKQIKVKTNHIRAQTHCLLIDFNTPLRLCLEHCRNTYFSMHLCTIAKNKHRQINVLWLHLGLMNALLKKKKKTDSVDVIVW